MKKFFSVFGAALVVVVGVFVVQGQTKWGVSPCTGETLPIDEIPEGGCIVIDYTIRDDAFAFRYPENTGGASSGDYWEVSHDSSYEDDGPFYRILIYRNEDVSQATFAVLFNDVQGATLADRSVMRSTSAKFPDPSYQDTIAYYAEVEGDDVMIIVSAFAPEHLTLADAILKDGFTWK